jgi:hypothetical protein
MIIQFDIQSPKCVPHFANTHDLYRTCEIWHSHGSQHGYTVLSDMMLHSLVNSLSDHSTTQAVIQMYSCSRTRPEMWMQHNTNVSKCWTCSLSRGVSERYFSRSSISCRFSLSSRRLAFCSMAFVSCNFSTSSVTVLLPCGCRWKHSLCIAR